jgi:hypothetical protein
MEASNSFTTRMENQPRRKKKRSQGGRGGAARRRKRRPNAGSQPDLPASDLGTTRKLLSLRHLPTPNNTTPQVISTAAGIQPALALLRDALRVSKQQVGCLDIEQAPRETVPALIQVFLTEFTVPKSRP